VAENLVGRDTREPRRKEFQIVANGRVQVEFALNRKSDKRGRGEHLGGRTDPKEHLRPDTSPVSMFAVPKPFQLDPVSPRTIAMEAPGILDFVSSVAADRSRLLKSNVCAGSGIRKHALMTTAVRIG